MDLDLERIRHLTARGQWTVDDIDWSQPLKDKATLSDRARREAGCALLFTAGLERQAAYIFELCARYVDDPTAREVYELFRQDELRHAEAEIRLAARYGVTWEDLPRGARQMIKIFDASREKELDPRAEFEFGSAFILLFELALDTILMPALKKLSDDPIQAEVFRRIDADESRHLAMDYWLLEHRGQKQKGLTIEEVFGRNRADIRLRDKLRSKARLAASLGILVMGFGSMATRIRALRGNLFDPSSVAKYLELVDKVPKKAPHALDVPAYRAGLTGQGHILKMLLLFSPKPKPTA